MESWDGKDRRQKLTSEELEELKEQLLESVYADIGRSVVKKVLWVIGAISVGIFAVGKGKGWF